MSHIGWRLNNWKAIPLKQQPQRLARIDTRLSIEREQLEKVRVLEVLIEILLASLRAAPTAVNCR